MLDELQKKMSVLDARESTRLNAISQKNDWRKGTTQWGDPLSILENKLIDKYHNATTVEKAIDVSHDILQTLNLVPDSAVFDFHRGHILCGATMLAGWAADQENPEWRKGKSCAAGSPMHSMPRGKYLSEAVEGKAVVRYCHYLRDFNEGYCVPMTFISNWAN